MINSSEEKTINNWAYILKNDKFYTRPTCPSGGEAEDWVMFTPALLVPRHDPGLVHSGPLQPLQVHLPREVVRSVLNGRGGGLGPGGDALLAVLHPEGGDGGVADYRPLQQVAVVLTTRRRRFKRRRSGKP